MRAKSLPAELLKKVRRLQIASGKRVDESLAGQFRAVFRGTGIEFEEVREYVAGDDVRSIDWNVTARAARPFVKRYTEERERRLMLLVDLSGSQQFGTRPSKKADLAAEVAALLAAAALKTNDKVGLIAFTDRIERRVPAKKGERHALRVIRDVLGFEPLHSGTDLKGTLEEVARTVRRGSILVLISDFVGAGFEDALRLCSRKHDMIVVRVVDPREENLPAVGLLSIADLETGAVDEIDTSSAGVRAAWAARFRARRTALEKLTRGAAADYLEVRTGEDYVEPLRRLFARRRLRRRHVVPRGGSSSPTKAGGSR